MLLKSDRASKINLKTMKPCKEFEANAVRVSIGPLKLIKPVTFETKDLETHVPCWLCQGGETDNGTGQRDGFKFQFGGA